MVASGLVEWVLKSVISTGLGPETAKRLEDVTKSLTVNAIMEGGMSWRTYAVLLLGGAIAAPIGEEFFFRGFLYNSAKRRLGVRAATCLSAAIFALVHVGPLAVVPIFFMGVLLAMAYERTRSLWVPIIMHMVNNGVAMTVSFLRPDLFK